MGALIAFLLDLARARDYRHDEHAHFFSEDNLTVEADDEDEEAEDIGEYL